MSSTLPSILDNGIVTDTTDGGLYSTELNVAPLTTVFRYDPACLGCWFLKSPQSTPFYIYKVDGEDDWQWSSCQPYSFQSVYIPAMCPESYAFHRLDEMQYRMNHKQYIDSREW